MLKIAFHPIYKHHLPDGHRFPMAKYDLLPRQLMHEGTCTQDHFFEPETVEDIHILRCHTQEYVTNLKALTIERREARKIGFPLSEELVPTRTHHRTGNHRWMLCMPLNMALL